MSYDVFIADESFNYTWNLGALFRESIPPDRSRGGIHELHELTGRQAAEVLAKAFERIDAEFYSIGEVEFRRKYDAPNGWGSAFGAVLFLARIMAACQAHPRSRVRLWT